MASEKWTPGPWHLGFAKSGARYIYADGKEQPLKPNVRVNKTITAEIVANAALMAAAADLFGALQELYEVADGLCDDPIPKSVCARVDAALAKARGEA